MQVHRTQESVRASAGVLVAKTGEHLADGMARALHLCGCGAVRLVADPTGDAGFIRERLRGPTETDALDGAVKDEGEANLSVDIPGADDLTYIHGWLQAALVDGARVIHREPLELAKLDALVLLERLEESGDVICGEAELSQRARHTDGAEEGL